jgi:transcriptional regulator with XRE-family HTH domain
MLRDWRLRRRMSRYELACDAEMSVKHLGSLETGRSPPGQQTLLDLAACLNVPLRDRNALLDAAGFAPVFQARDFHDPALAPVRRNVEIVLAAYDPNPALAIDRHWTLLAANRAVAHLVAGAEPTLLRPPVNLLRLVLHPAGLAPRVVNLSQWRAHVIARLRRQIDGGRDGLLMDLLEEIRDYPSAPRDVTQESGQTIAMPFRLATIDGVLSFFNMTTAFCRPVDITASELAIEAFLPADLATTQNAWRCSGRSSEQHPIDTLQRSERLPPCVEEGVRLRAASGQDRADLCH